MNNSRKVDTKIPRSLTSHVSRHTNRDISQLCEMESDSADNIELYGSKKS